MATALQEVRVDPDQWDVAIAAIDGPQLVVAGPGAGKTEFLVRRAVHLIEEHDVAPESVLLLSFSRRSTADLRGRITARLDRSFTVIPASTFHSFAFHLLEGHGAAQPAPTLLTGPEQVALVVELLNNEDPARWPLPFRPLLGTNTFAEEVADFLLRCQEHLIGPDGLAERAEERADWRGLPEFLERYRTALVERGRIDYGTLRPRPYDCSKAPKCAGGSASSSTTCSSTSTRTRLRHKPASSGSSTVRTGISPSPVTPTNPSTRLGVHSSATSPPSPQISATTTGDRPAVSCSPHPSGSPPRFSAPPSESPQVESFPAPQGR